MSLKSQGGPKNISKEYGRKLYIEAKEQDYITAMKRVTDAAIFSQALEKQSEFKKPYLEDDYMEMETYHPPKLPVLEWEPWRTSDRTIFPGPVPEGSDWVLGRGCIITCHSPLKCDGKVTCVPSIYSGDFDKLKFSVFLNGAAYPKWFVKSGIEPLNILPKDDCWDGDPFSKTRDVVTVEMTDAVNGQCNTTINVFCRKCECCESSAYVALTIDEANTDDTINNSTPATVTIINGCAPYNWSVSGTGYTIDPNGPSNAMSATVSVAAGICSINYDSYCTVTVSDCDGAHSVTKKIRHTGGTWKEKGSYVTSCGGATGSCPTGSAACAISGSNYDLDVGNERWKFTKAFCYYDLVNSDLGCSWSAFAGTPVLPPCGNPEECTSLTHAACDCGFEPPAVYQHCVMDHDTIADHACRYYKWECP